MGRLQLSRGFATSYTSTVTCEYLSNLINVMHVFNQVCVGHSPMHAWFLVIAFVLEVCVCVCSCVCVHVCMFMCVCSCVCICVSVRVYVSVGLSVSISLSVCVTLCVCMHACVCIYVLAPKVKITNGMIQVPYN